MHFTSNTLVFYFFKKRNIYIVRLMRKQSEADLEKRIYETNLFRKHSIYRTQSPGNWHSEQKFWLLLFVSPLNNAAELCKLGIQ